MNTEIRKNFGKLTEAIEPPNLLQNQIDSFFEFLQRDVPTTHRKKAGLEAVFREVFPIVSYDEKSRLEYVSYSIGESSLTEMDCIDQNCTYAAPLQVKLRLRLEVEGQSKPFYSEEEIFMGELPIVTERGSFIINGAERVVVSQLHRSPGVSFEESIHTSGKTLHGFRIIPDRGTWIEAQFDQHDLLYVYLDRRRRRRKFLITTFLRALLDDGKDKEKDSDQKIIELFYNIENLSIDELLKRDNVSNYVLVEPMFDRAKGAVLAKAFEPLTKTYLRAFQKAGESKLRAIDTSVDEGAIIRCLKKDTTKNKDEALKEIYKKLRPGEPPDSANAEALIKRLFLDSKRYDLAKVGRHMLNLKLNLNTPLEVRITTVEDLVAATRKLTDFKRGKSNEEKAREDAGKFYDMGIDDIDHLGNRRVRTVGELLANVCRSGLSRTERLVRERMTLYDQGVESLSPGKLINPKALTTVVRDFFARSQLSQFKDQINPLAEMTHKRRLSALGPGGLNRERAGFEVRDVHPTHYGRICPIETPEGPNIGLINSLSTYAKINKYGFIESPYKKVKDGVVQDKVEYLSAMEETKFTIAQANTKLDKNGKITEELVSCRQNLNFLLAKPDSIDYIDVSPKQLVSVAASLIPFLENDDANRALMGSNMMRQAVPLLKPESPLVGTGIESDVALDSGVTIVAKRDGVVDKIDGKRIVIKVTEETDFSKSGVDIYNLQKFKRSNQNTCINQRPLVRVGDKVKSGDIIADGPSTKLGELALGKNVTVAFMPWQGYNFEDSILISERCVTDDVFTSVHIVEYEIMARDTKLGEEEITRDIPNVNEEALKNLDESGIVYIGAEVNAGDILVGKVTPKGDSASGPEEKLLRSIFGEKAIDVTDTSLRMSRGSSGTVVDVRVFNRHGIEKDERSITIERAEIEQVQQDKIVEEEILERSIKQRASQFLSGSSLTKKVKDLSEGTKLDFDTINTLSINDVFKITVGNVNDEATLAQLKDQYNKAKQDITERFEDKVLKIRSGDDLLPSVMKMVKVFVAIKRRLRPGDKMSGRHGNKGVVSKIVPVEDMPYREDGRPVDIVLNPLGVPSRMNVGQILETHLGWACKEFGEQVKNLVNENNKKIERTEKIEKFLKSVYGEEIFNEKVDKLSKSEFKDLCENLQNGIAISTPVFDGAKEKNVTEMLELANLPGSGQTYLWDGRTGEKFDRPVTVGIIYMLKLHHLVEDKIHARSTGPYSLVTQQPLGGKAQLGGQRFGEMEVWALEAYGAAYTLQEILTVKSDDVSGRTKIYESLVKGDNSLQAGTPQSFNVLMKEMQSLCLDIRVRGEDAL